MRWVTRLWWWIQANQASASGLVFLKQSAGPFGFGGKAYYLLEPATWEMSQQAAVANFGDHLVTINDGTENAFIRNSVLDFNGNDYNG